MQTMDQNLMQFNRHHPYAATPGADLQTTPQGRGPLGQSVRPVRRHVFIKAILSSAGPAGNGNILEGRVLGDY
jgi:hypothetical protein